MPNEEPVEGPQGAEAELDGGSAQIVSSQKAQVSAEVIPLEQFPRGRLLALALMPVMEFPRRLTVVALRIGRGTAVRRQVLQELINPLVGGPG